MATTNLKQITNYNITEDVELVDKAVVFPNGKTKIVKFASFDLPNTSKFGYNCEPKGFDYPIYLTTKGIEKKYEIGVTGMFEIQPEIFKDVNDDNAVEKEVEIFITNVKVPTEIQFKIDYTAVIS